MMWPTDTNDDQFIDTGYTRRHGRIMHGDDVVFDRRWDVPVALPHRAYDASIVSRLPDRRRKERPTTKKAFDRLWRKMRAASPDEVAYYVYSNRDAFMLDCDTPFTVLVMPSVSMFGKSLKRVITLVNDGASEFKHRWRTLTNREV